ncbi:hypothetical protein [Deinococcus apachensis]|uniref:hypothetical protein n=1 Tax=Deinococcus apachensis TaxID=309886 RepID=UPI0003688FED|nr:hypothetical protein [Deinococcus apachensis]
MLQIPFARPFPVNPVQVEEEALLRRICVRPPYFALQALQFDGETFGAQVRAELPQGAELGPIQGAELSRHAAIAGLCRAALEQGDDKRRYYLAQQARYEGYPSDAPYGSPVALRAALIDLSKRMARTSIVATVGGVPLAHLEVEYTVLTEAAFERLFQSRRRPTPESGAAMGALPPGLIERRGQTLTRTLEGVPAEACAGHFEHYPAMPVAILMGQLAELAGLGLGGGRVPYRVVRGRVEAQDFCWAGEPARFEVTPAAHEGKLHTFRCAAHASGRLTGSMDLTLQPVEVAGQE